MEKQDEQPHATANNSMATHTVQIIENSQDVTKIKLEDSESSCKSEKNLEPSNVLSFIFRTTGSGGFRDDIGAVRAVAIISVLLFHFWPTFCPMGFLGVDVFFVISGYLMMSILMKTDFTRLDSVPIFYYRRIKRIWPLYYLVFMIAGLGGIMILSGGWLFNNFVAYRESLIFTLNIHHKRFQKDYFNEVNDFDIFLHGWSLSVEMQFYLLAPLFVFLYKKLANAGRLCIARAFFGLICAASYGIMFYLQRTNNLAFYRLEARIWQFMCGMIAQSLSRRTSEKQQVSSSLFIGASLLQLLTLSVTLTCLAVPITFFDDSTLNGDCSRTIITVASAILLNCGSISTLHVASLDLIQYTGTISYALYLVHWPVLKLFVYQAQWRDDQECFCKEKYVAFLLSVFISIVIHHVFEKPMLRQKAKTVLVILSALILCSYGMWRLHKTLHMPFTGGRADVVARNFALIKGTFIHPDATYIECEEFCKGPPFGIAEFPPGNGTATIMVLGNSYATQQVRVIRRVIGDLYSNLTMYSQPGSNVLYSYGQKYEDFVHELVAERRPDIVIILVRYLLDEFQPFNETKDTMLENFVRNVHFLAKHTDHILIEYSHPIYGLNFLNNFFDLVEHHRIVHTAHMDLKGVDESLQHLNTRLQKTLSACGPKCKFLHSDEPFIDRKRGLVYTFDRKTMESYVDNTMHLTEPGLAMLDDSYASVIRPILDNYPYKGWEDGDFFSG